MLSRRHPLLPLWPLAEDRISQTAFQKWNLVECPSAYWQLAGHCHPAIGCLAIEFSLPIPLALHWIFIGLPMNSYWWTLVSHWLLSELSGRFWQRPLLVDTSRVDVIFFLKPKQKRNYDLLSKSQIYEAIALRFQYVRHHVFKQGLGYFFHFLPLLSCLFPNILKRCWYP